MDTATFARRVRARLGRSLPADSRRGQAARRVAGRLGVPTGRPTVRVINEFARLEPNATFVQIGANDGAALDPLHDAIAIRNWRGVMVEPVPYVCDRLRANMSGNPRVAIENVAIDRTDGTRDFFHLAKAAPGEEVWEFYHALGSFDRDVVLSHRDLVPDIEDRLVTTPVRCMTFDALCARHGYRSVDVVQIDTEGYDHVVLGLIDFDRYRPQIVMFEHLHLAPEVHQALRSRLASHGYTDIIDGMDTLAVHRDALARHRSLARAVRAARMATSLK
jgi:FkbM family methyltransferase